MNSSIKTLKLNTAPKEIGLWRQRLGYGSSDFACNLIWQMISLYLLYFYTDVMRLNAAQVSVMFLVIRVLDGFTDLLVGYLIDRTHTRWGKSRPWILGGAVPFAISAYLAFSVPDLGQTEMLVYAYVTYFLLSLCYGLVNIPMASILPALSNDPKERTNLAVSRMLFSTLGATVVSSMGLVLVDALGKGDEASGFRWTMLIFGIIGCLIFIFCFFNTRENIREQQERVSIKSSIKALTKNKPWLLFALNILWMFGGSIIQGSAVIFYFAINLNNRGLVTLAATLTAFVPIISDLTVPILIKFISKRNLMIIGSVINGIGIVIIFLSGTHIPLVMTGVIIASLGQGLKMSMHFAIQPDPVDYSEWKSGINISGTLSAANGFVGKAGMAIAGSLGAALLAMGGYDSTLTLQPDSALRAIATMYIWVPLVSNFLTIITFMFYDLDKQHPQIMAELEATKIKKEGI